MGCSRVNFNFVQWLYHLYCDSLPLLSVLHMMKHKGKAIPLQIFTLQEVEAPDRYSLENEDSFLSNPIKTNKIVKSSRVLNRN